MSNRPKPTELRKVGGNAGHRPLNDAEPKATPGIPSMPAGLSDEMEEEWLRWSQELFAMGVLTVADGLALEGLVIAAVRFRQAEADTTKYGQVVEETVYKKTKVKDEDGKTQYVEEATGEVRLKRNPATAIAREQSQLMKSYLAEFGMTPAARSKVKTTGQEKENPLDAWLKKQSSGTVKPTDS